MVGVSGPGTGHHPAHFETSGTGADLDHLAAIAVAQRHIAIELVAHGLQGSPKPFSFHFIQDLFDKVGSLFCFSQQAFLAQREHHPLSAGGDKRFVGADDDPPVAQHGPRYVLDADYARLKVLEHLFHDIFQTN